MTVYALNLHSRIGTVLEVPKWAETSVLLFYFSKTAIVEQLAMNCTFLCVCTIIEELENHMVYFRGSPVRLQHIPHT